MFTSVDAGDDLEIRSTDGSGHLFAKASSAGFLDATDEQVRCVHAYRPNSGSSGVSPAPDAPLVLTVGGQVESAQDVALRVVVFYRDVKLADA